MYVFDAIPCQEEEKEGTNEPIKTRSAPQEQSALLSLCITLILTHLSLFSGFEGSLFHFFGMSCSRVRVTLTLTPTLTPCSILSFTSFFSKHFFCVSVWHASLPVPPSFPLALSLPHSIPPPFVSLFEHLCSPRSKSRVHQPVVMLLPHLSNRRHILLRQSKIKNFFILTDPG